MPQVLSPRQRACLDLAAQGLTDKEIAAELGMSPRTVGGHLGEAYLRLGVSNRREAIRALGIDYAPQPLPMAQPVSDSASDGASADETADDPRSWRSLMEALPAPPGRRMRLVLILLVAIGVAVVIAGIVLVMTSAIEQADRLAPGNAL